MNFHGKPSRMERQVRNQARGLFFVSGALLIACATMTGLYGWSLGLSIVEKAIFALGLTAVDLAGAYLISLSGTCSANRETRTSWGASLAAVLCFGMTVLGIVGFQSSSRETQASARDQVTAVTKDFLLWSKDMTVNLVQTQSKGKESKTANPTATMVAGIEAVGEAVEKQAQKIASGERSAVSDAQAVTLARVTGISEANARSLVITMTSVALLAIQYSCWWFYGYTRQRLEPLVAGQTTQRQFKGKSADGLPADFRQNSKAEAKTDLEALLTQGIEVCVSDCAERWGVDTGTASKWTDDFCRELNCRKVQRGKRKVIVRRPSNVVPIKSIKGDGVA